MRKLGLGWIVLSGLVGCGEAPHAVAILAAGNYPDLLATSPASLYLKPDGGAMQLRFGNTIANVGPGQFRLRGEIRGDHTVAIQEIVDAAGNVLESKQVGVFEYHPTHHHTHVDGVALYELRQGGEQGALVAQAKKVSYCMEDTIQYSQGWTPRLFAKCTETLQGVSPGWADVYANDVPDQFLNVTGLPAGEYTLVTTIDPTQKFLDANRANNRSWVKIYLDVASYQVRRLDQSMDAPSRVTGEGQYWRPFWRGLGYDRN